MAENQNIEYKESWRDEYLRWVCGFANAQGGKIYVGVDDSGNVVGVDNAKKLSESSAKAQICNIKTLWRARFFALLTK